MKLSRSSIRRQAHEVLQSAGASSLPIDAEAIARHWGVDVRRVDGGGEDVSGFLHRKGGKPIIGVNASQHLNRQRFTIAHELGHFFLHKFDGIHLDKTFHRNGISSLGVSSQEVEANTFAAELLMPDYLVKRELLAFRGDLITDDEVSRLADRFGVSTQAMGIRLSNLGYVAL